MSRASVRAHDLGAELHSEDHGKSPGEPHATAALPASESPASDTVISAERRGAATLHLPRAQNKETVDRSRPRATPLLPPYAEGAATRFWCPARASPRAHRLKQRHSMPRPGRGRGWPTHVRRPLRRTPPHMLRSCRWVPRTCRGRQGHEPCPQAASSTGSAGAVSRCRPCRWTGIAVVGLGCSEASAGTP